MRKPTRSSHHALLFEGFLLLLEAVHQRGTFRILRYGDDFDEQLHGWNSEKIEMWAAMGDEATKEM